jgi:hypothetical protein
MFDGKPRKPAVTGVTHVSPEDHVFKVVHENGNIAPTQVSVGKPAQVGQYRISVRMGDEEGGEEPAQDSYPGLQQRDISAGQPQPGPVSARGAHVFLKPGDVSRFGLDLVHDFCGLHPVVFRMQEYEIPPDGNVVFVVDEDIQLEVFAFFPMIPLISIGEMIVYRSGILRQEFSCPTMMSILNRRKP